jgi:hypothetical protein
MTDGPDLIWLIQTNQEDMRTVLAIQDMLDELGVRWSGVDIDFASSKLSLTESLRDGEIALCHTPVIPAESGDPLLRPRRWINGFPPGPALGIAFGDTCGRE